MNNPKLIGTKEHCMRLLEAIEIMKEKQLLGFGWFIEDLSYNVEDDDTINNEKEIYDEVRDKVFDLIYTLEGILKKQRG